MSEPEATTEHRAVRCANGSVLIEFRGRTTPGQESEAQDSEYREEYKVEVLNGR